jgi:hypothetical protein
MTMNLASLPIGQRYHVTGTTRTPHTRNVYRFHDPATGVGFRLPIGTTLELEAARTQDFYHCVRMLEIVRTYRVLDGPFAERSVAHQWVDGFPEPWSDPPEGLASIA